MKTKFKKIKVFLLTLSLSVMGAVMVSASEYGEQHTHIDHVDSEDCIYSCSHSMNNYSSVSDVWSTAELEKFEAEYKQVSSAAEMAAFISKYSGIPFSEADLEEMHAIAKKVQLEMIDSDFVKAYKDVSSDLEMVEFIAEYSGVSVDEVDLEEMRNGTITLTENPYEVQASCDHVYWGVCQGNHSTPNEKCEVARCERFAVCTYNCGSTTTIVVECEEHSWSEGWCGRTCTVCDTIEKLHEPGECWYCS